MGMHKIYTVTVKLPMDSMQLYFVTTTINSLIFVKNKNDIIDIEIITNDNEKIYTVDVTTFSKSTFKNEIIEDALQSLIGEDGKIEIHDELGNEIKEYKKYTFTRMTARKYELDF